MVKFAKLSGIEERRLSVAGHHGFLVRNRRNKLFALWAAAEMRLSDTAAAAYARDIVALGIAEARDEVLVAHIRVDLQARDIAATEWEIRDRLVHFAEVAALEFGGDEGPTKKAA